MQVAKWGNSLAVRLPAALVETLGLKEGDNISFIPVSAREVEIEKVASVEDALAVIRTLRRPLPENWKLDRDDPASWRGGDDA